MTSNKYPTYYLKPDRDSRIVREVVYAEMERLSKFRVRPDVLLTTSAVYSIYGLYRRLDYSIPELLSTYETVDKRVDERPRVETIPWELVPEDILERCLNSSMELEVTDELLEFLGFKKKNSIFDKHKFPTRFIRSRDSPNVIESPRYSKDGKLVCKEYLVYDAEVDSYRRALVRKKGSYSTRKTEEEISYVVEMFSRDNSRNSLGLRTDLMASTVGSITRLLREFRKEYFGESYIDRLTLKSVDELRKERLKDEKEYAVSLRGRYSEDTSVLWRYGQHAD